MTAELSGGSVHISNYVLADLAGYAAMESFGVVGMAAPSLRDGLVQMLPQHKLRRGIKIVNSCDENGEILPGTVEVDLYVVIEYGTQLAEVSRNLADTVRHRLTSMTDIEVGRVDVHVLEVKVRQGE